MAAARWRCPHGVEEQNAMPIDPGRDAALRMESAVTHEAGPPAESEQILSSRIRVATHGKQRHQRTTMLMAIHFQGNA
jgi:hypothetical protein